MNSPLHIRPLPPRVMELLADRALDGLAPEERAELMGSLAVEGMSDDWSFDLAASKLNLVTLPSPHDPMPQDVKQRLAAVGKAWSLDRQRQAGTPVAVSPPASLPFPQSRSAGYADSPRGTPFAWGGWAVAAVLAIASLVTFVVRQPGTGADSLAVKPGVISAASDAFTAQWADWDNPEVSGVVGNVTWSDSLQRGVMTFKGLPRNDSTKTQYQLWIIDERGLSQRISGAIFDSTGDETKVEVRPSIAVRNAAAFALTIEGPGGTWVSDMTRRVVIAKKV